MHQIHFGGGVASLLLRFSQTCGLWSSKANWQLRLSLPSIILTDLLGNKLYFNGFKRSLFVICDWWMSIRFMCFCVSRFVACDHNYDWRQRETQLWRRPISFRVRVFLKSTVKVTIESHSTEGCNRRALFAKTRGLPAFSCLSTERLFNNLEKVQPGMAGL